MVIGFYLFLHSVNSLLKLLFFILHVYDVLKVKEIIKVIHCTPTKIILMMLTVTATMMMMIMRWETKSPL